MASSRKPRIGTKRTGKNNDASAEKEDGAASKNRARKHKLSDTLGPPWTKDELERFYEAYRKHGRDWKKVASMLRHRTIAMVDSLYNLNKAYLSLPEGSASSAGLIAMMTDHYCLLGGIDSGGESSDDGLMANGHLKKQSHVRQKTNSINKNERFYPDLLQYKSGPSNGGCPSPVKKKRSAGRVVGKRTPRFPVTFSMNKQDSSLMHFGKRGNTSFGDQDDNDFEKAAALALTEVSNRAASPQISHTPSRISTHARASPRQNGDFKGSFSRNDSAGSGMKPSASMDEGSLDGSQEVGNGSMGGESKVEGSNIRFRVKKPLTKRTNSHIANHKDFDNIKEECSCTEEGMELNEDHEDMTTVDERKRRKPPLQRSKKRNRQLFSGGESSGLDALATLAFMSQNGLPLSPREEPESPDRPKELSNEIIRSERPRKQLKDFDITDRKPKMFFPRQKGSEKSHENNFEVGMKEKHSANLKPETGHGDSLNDFKKKRRKTTTTKLLEALGDPCFGEPQKQEDLAVDGPKFRHKHKKLGGLQISSKNSKPTKALSETPLDNENTSPTGRVLQIPSQSNAEQVSLPKKFRSRRKAEPEKLSVAKFGKPKECSDSCGNMTGNGISGRHGDVIPFCSHIATDKTSGVKTKLVHCLSSSKLRRWCTYEWFYSAIDWPWFVRNEFVEYLKHAGLGHVPRLTRVEWSVIRSSLGKPRRLSKMFLEEERKKLHKYREDVRNHYNEVRAGILEGLPTDLARPLSVGQRVIACHPKTREVHDGSILTVDKNRCRVQFDRQELGVEFVLDIDCMPLNPLENVPEAFRKKSVQPDPLMQNFDNAVPDVSTRGWFPGITQKVANETSLSAPTKYSLNTLLNQAKVDTVDSVIQAKAIAHDAAVAAQQAMYSQPCTLAQVQAREADIRALAELTRALDKKEAILVELRNMNDEVDLHKKNGEGMRNTENFQRQYAAVLQQLKEANEQVSAALTYLRQRNTYQENSGATWQRTGRPTVPFANPRSADPSAILVSDLSPHIVEIVHNSRMKAQILVDGAVQEMRYSKSEECTTAKLNGVLDSGNLSHANVESTGDSGKPAAQLDCSKNGDHIDNKSTFSASEIKANNTVEERHKSSHEKKEISLPSDLITSCISTLLMIQTCTDRQYPPADVAQILDIAVRSLHPQSDQNLVIYGEIQQGMGVLKNQILALIPTHPNISVSAELPTVPRQ